MIQALRAGFELQSKERSYRIVGVLGSGSFGITYLAASEISVGNISVPMRFAIKEHFISASCYRADDGVAVLTVPTAEKSVRASRSDFLTEANRLKKLCKKTRNIVSVNETFEANGTAYYVMEYLDGGSISRCSEDESVSVVLQIADALKEIHKERVLHLDIKPDNIILKSGENGEKYPVLIDFGISKHFDSENKPTSSLSAKGASPGYAPQEQYAGVGEFSPKYDIYAIGAVLFYLCTGKNPPDAFKISPNQQELKVELAGKVSSRIEKTILNAMKPAASERTSSIERFCDDLLGIDFFPVLNILDSQVNFRKDKERISVSVDSNINWIVYSKEKWCTVRKSGKTVIISVTKNRDASPRTCDVFIENASYQISQAICIRQEGRSTIIFPQKPTWWTLYKKRICQTGGIIIAVFGMVGLCIFLESEHRKSNIDDFSDIPVVSAVYPKDTSSIVSDDIPINDYEVEKTPQVDEEDAKSQRTEAMQADEEKARQRKAYLQAEANRYVKIADQAYLKYIADTDDVASGMTALSNYRKVLEMDSNYDLLLGSKIKEIKACINILEKELK